MPEQPDIVKIFCSYAHEDADLLQAFINAFTKLNDLVSRNIVFYADKEIGFGLSINEEIEKHLKDSDILFVLYTGILKKAHSYTGFEIGYFQAILNDDAHRGKRVVPIYLENPPPVATDILGIKIGLEPTQLELGREAYTALVKANPPKDIDADPLAKLLFDIAQLAEERKPTSSDPRELVRQGIARTNKILTDVFPALKAEIYDSLSRRVAASEIEQLLIRFEFPNKYASDRNLTGASPRAFKARVSAPMTILLRRYILASGFLIGSATGIVPRGSGLAPTANTAGASFAIGVGKASYARIRETRCEVGARRDYQKHTMCSRPILRPSFPRLSVNERDDCRCTKA
jgi:hypothetical protein